LYYEADITKGEGKFYENEIFILIVAISAKIAIE
jgi:hypothetical protein